MRHGSGIITVVTEMATNLMVPVLFQNPQYSIVNFIFTPEKETILPRTLKTVCWKVSFAIFNV